MMKARMNLWEKLWAEPLTNSPSHWCGLIPPPPLHRGKYKRGRPAETRSHTHTRAGEGHSFEWVIQWETWQRWVCWKTVLPLFAGPPQRRQWSGANRWTSCSSTNVRHFTLLWMNVMKCCICWIPVAWLESTGMAAALLHCFRHACFLSTSCSVEQAQWLS